MEQIRPFGQGSEALTTDHHVGQAAAQIRAAQLLLKSKRTQGWAELNEIFRTGVPPEPPLQGRYQGKLVALNLMPGLTELFQLITSAWLPWRGKRFNATEARGDNILTRDSLLLARIGLPFYRGFVIEGPETYRAFVFRTYVAPGLADPDRQVLKIDYNLVENPRWSVRRILDELVQLEPGFYLGKAHVKWWWGTWQTVAYFSLEDSDT